MEESSEVRRVLKTVQILCLGVGEGMIGLSTSITTLRLERDSSATT